jgi:hypothetical protein
MLVNFFRSDRPVVIITLLMLGLIAWVFGFVYDFGQPINSIGVVQSFVKNINESEGLSTGIALLLHLLVAALVNILCNRYSLVEKKYYVVAFSYLLITIGSMEGYLLSTNVLSNLLVAVMMFRLFQLPSTSRPKSAIFDASFLVGLMSIVAPANVFILSIVWGGIMMFRTLDIREWMISVLGFMLPILYLIVALYLFDSLYLIEQWQLQVQVIKIMDAKYIILLGVALLFVPSLIVYIGSYNHKTAVTRKMLNLVLFLFVVEGVSSIAFNNGAYVILSVLVPVSIVIGTFVEQVKKVIIAESLVILFIVVAGYYYYLNWS